MTQEIIAATDEALKRVAEARFLRTERGFQGQFYCALQHELGKRGLLRGRRILEMEYQKSDRHGTSQRPDIILHVPAEDLGVGVARNNFALWALKRHATKRQVRDDFHKLDAMFRTLCYALGIFVNIDAPDHFAAFYRGSFPERVRAVAVWPEGRTIRTCWGSPVKVRRGSD